MPWRYRSEDNLVEVIVDPNFDGDLVALAAERPVWIVNSPQNARRIDGVRAMGPDQNLFEVTRCQYDDTSKRLENFLDILGCLDDHHPHHNIVVHGLDARDVRAEIEGEGFRVSKLITGGFVAVQDVALRNRLIGRA